MNFEYIVLLLLYLCLPVLGISVTAILDNTSWYLFLISKSM